MSVGRSVRNAFVKIAENDLSLDDLKVNNGYPEKENGIENNFLLPFRNGESFKVAIGRVAMVSKGSFKNDQP